MKVIGFNGSPHTEGNTFFSLNVVAEQLKKSGIDFEIVNVGNKLVRGCMGCGKCLENRDEQCIIKNDIVNECVQKVKEADGFLFGSPVHFSGVGGTMKSFMDRLFYVCGTNGKLFRHKVGVSVISVRRSGGVSTFDELNHYIQYAEMLMPTSNYWNVIHGGAPGEAEKDVEGVQCLTILGENMAWLMNLVESGKNIVAEPPKQDKIFMNFIR